MACKIPYSDDYIAKLCVQQAEVIQNIGSAGVLNIGHGKA
jgi:hypothetical protein